MTDEELAALRLELAEKLKVLTRLTDEATEMRQRLNEAEAERDSEPATIYELHPR